MASESLPILLLQDITQKLVIYLKALKKNEPLVYNNNEQIKQMEELAQGPCFPNSILFSFVNTIQDNSSSENPQDNFNWFLTTTNSIYNWNGDLHKLSNDQRKEIDRLINHILWIAFSDKYLNKILDPLQISKSIEIDKNRNFKKIFHIAGLLSEKQLSTVLGFLPNNSSILVGTNPSTKAETGHIMGIYKKPDGTYLSQILTSKNQGDSENNITAHIMKIMKISIDFEEYESQDRQKLVPMNIMAFAISDATLSINFYDKYLESTFKLVNYTPQQFSHSYLHSLACFSYESTKHLISKTTDFNISGFDGYTPLHYSVERKFYTLTKNLILKGANIYIKNIEGDCPLNYAIKNSNLKMIKLILTHSEKQKLFPPIYYYAKYLLLQNKKNIFQIKAYYHQNIVTLDSSAKKEIIILANKYNNTGLLKQMFLSELNAYININQPKVVQAFLSSTEIYESFWARITGFSLRINVAAAIKLRDALEEKSVTFEDIDMKALRADFLGETLARFEKVLPNCFLKAERQEAECQHEETQYQSNTTYFALK